MISVLLGFKRNRVKLNYKGFFLSKTLLFNLLKGQESLLVCFSKPWNHRYRIASQGHQAPCYRWWCHRRSPMDPPSSANSTWPCCQALPSSANSLFSNVLNQLHILYFSCLHFVKMFFVSLIICFPWYWSRLYELNAVTLWNKCWWCRNCLYLLHVQLSTAFTTLSLFFA